MKMTLKAIVLVVVTIGIASCTTMHREYAASADDVTIKIKDVTLDQVDEKGGTISVSFGEEKKPTGLVDVPLGKEAIVVASHVAPGSVNHLPFRWEYVERLQGKVVSVRLVGTGAGLSVVSIASGND